MTRLFWLLLAALLLAAIAQSAAAQNHLLFTADTQGHVGPCEHCPGQHGLGSLPRRQTLLNQLRQREPNSLLLDAGNALFGDESLPSSGAVIIAAYNTLGYEAVNISYRDFRLGKSATLAALQGALFSPLSANLLDASTAKPLFQAYVIKTVGGEKFAIVGACEAPAALPMLPELAQQLAGITIAPPADALAAVLPKARAQAAHVVLLFYGSAAAVAPVRQKLGASIDLILMGGTQPGEIPTGGSPPLFATFSHGRELADVTLTAGKPPTLTQWAVVGQLATDPAMKKLIAAYPTGVGPLNISAAPSGSSSAIDHLDPGQTQSLASAASNHSVELRVNSVSLLERLGDAPAPDGTLLLVINAQFRNLQPPQMADGQLTPVQYQVPNLADNLYAVADDSQVLPRASIDAAGLIPFDQLALEKQNDTVVGNIVYAVPKAAIPHDLKLRFYDFAHGNIILPVLAGSFTPTKPLAPPQHNEVVEAAVFGLTKPDKLGDQQPPPGGTFMLLDLRARSTTVTSVPASAFDVHAAADAKIDVGTVTDWTDSRKYIQLVADGQYAAAPLDDPATTLAETPRFLPDVMTGGLIAFVVPANAKSLELRCEFPNAAKPDGTVIRPKPLLFPLLGSASAAAMPKPIASWADDPFHIDLLAVTTADHFATKQADDGKRFVVLDVCVGNTGTNTETFQPVDQLKLATADGSKLDSDPATLDGIHRPIAHLLVPVGEHRRFEMAYQLDATETHPRLAYNGVSAPTVIDLPALAAATAPATQASAELPITAPAAATPAPAATIEIDGKEYPAEVPVLPPRQPQGLAGVGLTAEQVNTAIDKGAAALWANLQKEQSDGESLGDHKEDVLECLALVHAGGVKKFPAFNTLLRQYLATGAPKQVLLTYQNALLCMLIEAYGDPAFYPQLRNAAQLLLNVQQADGTWGYDVEVPDAGPPPPAVPITIAGSHAPGDSAGAPLVRQPSQYSTHTGGDNSATQFALLGLYSAERTGLQIPPDAWKRILDTTRDRQSKDDGGWEYHGGGGSYGSMTTAGICAVALDRYEMGEKDFTNDLAIRRGLAWLSANFTVEENPHENDYHYYYLYSLERVGRILNTEFINDHEWYPIGARYLIDHQSGDGNWSGEASETDAAPALPDSFALLFLTRATPPPIRPQRTGPGQLITAAVAPPGRRIYIILDCSGSMMDMMGDQQKFDIARNSVRSLLKDLPDNSLVALRAYGYRLRATEPDCDLDTKLLSPMATIDRDALGKILDGLRARGKTPLTLSLEQTMDDLSSETVDADHPVLVLLLTDGGEDTWPRKNPVPAAKKLGEIPGMGLSIVGFDINQQDWDQQLRAMAAAAHGHYVAAAKGAELQKQIRAVAATAPDSFSIVDASGKTVFSGPLGQGCSLPPGQYHFVTSFGGKKFDEPFWANAGETTSITFDAGAVH